MAVWKAGVQELCEPVLGQGPENAVWRLQKLFKPRGHAAMPEVRGARLFRMDRQPKI